MGAKQDALVVGLSDFFADKVTLHPIAFGEVMMDVGVAHYLEVMQSLKENPAFSFEEMLDLCGVDYLEYQGDEKPASRFAVVVHLTSLTHNHRLRVRVCLENDDFPVIPSLTKIWNSANWNEREAFDLFGILFEGHDDLRRLLTDYGFVGHPFRKDFPIYGHLEMRYDAASRRLVYEPVTIEPREVTPRIVREKGYGDL